MTQSTRPGWRILQIAHSHPRFHPGGTELTALALHREALKSGMDSWFLGALDQSQVAPNQGTQMIALSDDHREAALFVDTFRLFALAQDDHFGFLREFRNYLEQLRPDVVHVHHLLNFGLEALYVIRSALPDAKIVLTLHDYYLICANNGRLYIHETGQRCPGPTLTECLKCFPKRSANEFAMRALDIRNALSLCDLLVSPSHFLKRKFEHYLGGGPAITMIENGYLGTEVTPAEPADPDQHEMVFGYFGNISAAKGLSDLLDAADLLVRRGLVDFRLEIHGAQLMEDGKLDERMRSAKATLDHRVRFFGSYKPEEMGQHLRAIDCLVFPSVWWENAPLVIYEALYHGRQVVCYPHGGGPEILARYGAGIIAERSDPAGLADAMARLIGNRSLASITPEKPVPGRRELLESYVSCYFGN